MIPFIVTLGWIIGKPMSLLFDPFESVVLFLSGTSPHCSAPHTFRADRRFPQSLLSTTQYKTARGECYPRVGVRATRPSPLRVISVVSSALLTHVRSNWLEGMVLMCLYVIVAVVFWYYPGERSVVSAPYLDPTHIRRSPGVQELSSGLTC